MIQYAARTCSLTIIGKNEATLRQLMKRHPDSRITEAMGNFALYQFEEMAGRRFPISRTFEAFVRKFDLFADAGSVDRRLADERRWFREQITERQNLGPDGMPVSSQPPPGEEPEERRRASIDFMLRFNRGLERGARHRGITVEQLLGPDQNTLGKYKLFKQRLEKRELLNPELSDSCG